VGADVLREGGNAIDAAVATAFALEVTYPRAGNLGGGGFAVIRLADGRVTSIDFREVAPARATRGLLLDAAGCVVPGRSTVGYLASGVPGTVAGLALADQKYGSGRLSWAQLIEPARRLASRGFAVTPALDRDLRGAEKLLAQFPESRRIYLRDGRLYRAGELFRQPDLGVTLTRLQRHGPREFYTGRTARSIADDMAAHGGLITGADLAAYRAVERVPLRGSYRGYEVVTMPPPSSGGIALLQMLGMLEPHDVGALGLDSAAKIHLFAEVMRRAFRDRAEFVGDPDFVQVPVAALLDPAYLARRMSDFDPARATSNDARPVGVDAVTHESTDTTHFSVIDSAGDAVSITYTLNGLWGSGVTVPGAGFLLNNEMDDFTAKADVQNAYGLMQGEANAIVPGKRPLSSMTPTIVLKDGNPFLITGSPGGPTIINTVLLVITNVIDHGLSITQAVDAPTGIAGDIRAEPLARDLLQRAVRFQCRDRAGNRGVPLRIAFFGRHDVRLRVKRAIHDFKEVRRLDVGSGGGQIGDHRVQTQPRPQREVAESHGLIARNHRHVLKWIDNRRSAWNEEGLVEIVFIARAGSDSHPLAGNIRNRPDAPLILVDDQDGG
jgi:gamma-glutamyltranspeptidase/glutathione hydrolase